MSALHPTMHAMMRMAQRGITISDADLIQSFGSEVEGGYLFREKDFAAVEHDLKRLRDRTRRLVGKRVVLDGNVIITAYHATGSKAGRLLRRVPERSQPGD